MTADKTSVAAEATWLSGDQIGTWRALHGVISALPDVLGSELRRKFDLSFLEYYVLACCSEQADHKLRMSRLAFLTSSELSRLSHLVHRLEKRGLVRREPDPADKRFTLVVLTADGHALVTQAAPVHVGHVRHLIFDVLDETEQHALHGALMKILTNLTEGSSYTT
jgi:DNA-binding MarR family transcriptional regulator